MWPTRAERQAGFSLLEILVAFTILATVITVLLQVFAGGLRNLRVGEDYVTAAAVAEARLAEVGRAVPVVAGEDDGVLGDYHWRRSIVPYDGLPLSDLAVTVLFAVEVTVRWGEGRSARSLSLTTLRAAPREAGA